MTSANSSPGGTKTMDFHLGGVGNDEQAAMLDDMLADAEADDEQRARESPFASQSKTRPSPGGGDGRRVMDMKPSELAAKYGVDPVESDSDGEDDFGPDTPPHGKGRGGDDEAKAEAKADSNHGFDWAQAGPTAELAQKNMALEGELDQRRAQVRKLGVMLEALAPVPGMDAERLLDVLEGQDVEQADPRDVKIVSLAKKSRNLNLENDKLKQKAAAAEKRAAQKEEEAARLREQIEAMASPAARALIMKQLAGGGGAAADTRQADTMGKENSSSSSSSSSAYSGEAAAALRRKDKELVEARRRVAKAAEESKKFKGALHRELGLAPGEDLPRSILQPDAAAAAGEKPFKGRAETIVLLRSKCKRLEADLERATGRKDPKRAARAGFAAGEHRDVDRQADEELRSMEDARRQAMEQLTEDYQSLASQYHGTKDKLDASKARGVVLENENAKFKKQMRTLLSKGDDDDALVEELRSELQSLRVELHETKQKLDSHLSGRSYGATRTMVAGTQVVGGSLPTKQRMTSSSRGGMGMGAGGSGGARPPQQQQQQAQVSGSFRGFGIPDNDDA